ncbi:hypothetical protein BKA70DRAFT_1435368 [Coprinopsis sp. MPI-PUGE-AT-0042]|nr:hypothetical protein BKA70DRAFT_1435368 [Coprinopsis sp. MPI-PUGE-AT-0042]
MSPSFEDLPQEILNQVIDCLKDISPPYTLLPLTSTRWVYRSRSHQFHTVLLNGMTRALSFATLLQASDSTIPPHGIRELHIRTWRNSRRRECRESRRLSALVKLVAGQLAGHTSISLDVEGRPIELVSLLSTFKPESGGANGWGYLSNLQIAGAAPSLSAFVRRIATCAGLQHLDLDILWDDNSLLHTDSIAQLRLPNLLSIGTSSDSLNFLRYLSPEGIPQLTEGRFEIGDFGDYTTLATFLGQFGSQIRQVQFLGGGFLLSDDCGPLLRPMTRFASLELDVTELSAGLTLLAMAAWLPHIRSPAFQNVLFITKRPWSCGDALNAAARRFLAESGVKPEAVSLNIHFCCISPRFRALDETGFTVCSGCRSRKALATLADPVLATVLPELPYTSITDHSLFSLLLHDPIGSFDCHDPVRDELASDPDVDEAWAEFQESIGN